MTEKLKGIVSYGLTINLGNYNSQRFDATLEFYLSEMTFAQAFQKVKEIIAEQRQRSYEQNESR